MIKIDGKTVILGDCHFGKSKFSHDLFNTQMDFFRHQLFPHMEKEGIKTIIQLGDFFDNRRNADINFMNSMQELFEMLRHYGIVMYEILGNHDIYYKNTRDINLMKIYEKMYPDVLKVISEKTYFELDGERCMFVPWVLESESVTAKELDKVTFLFGHFEIKNFQMSKGHYDETSKLTGDFFTRRKSLKKVFSGHYHLVADKGKVMYCGTPYQLDWGDYDDHKSYYIIDVANEELTKHYNEVSRKFVKVKYNANEPKGMIEVKGLDLEAQYYDSVSEIDTEILRNQNMKFYINEIDDTKYHEEVIFLLREKGCDFKVTNNVEISNLIGTDYVHESDEEHVSSKQLVVNTITAEAPELVELMNEIFEEITQEE